MHLTVSRAAITIAQIISIVRTYLKTRVITAQIKRQKSKNNNNNLKCNWLRKVTMKMINMTIMKRAIKELETSINF